MTIARRPIPKAVQVQVFRRDRWLCRWCLRPVVFPPTLKYLERFARQRGCSDPLAYFQANWRRDAAPLLDELGASVDHVEAHVKGGSSAIENLATICAKCNARKGSRSADDHLKRNPLRKVKGKHGEPLHWDGLSSVFLVLVDENLTLATATEKRWIAALKQLRVQP